MEQMHLRPATVIAEFLEKFPKTQFSVYRVIGGQTDLTMKIDPKSILALQLAELPDGDELEVHATGDCEELAVAFLSSLFEIIGNFSCDGDQNGSLSEQKADINAILDSKLSPMILDEHDASFKRNVVINDRLHSLTLSVLPELTKHFQSNLELRFYVHDSGIEVCRISESDDFKLPTDAPFLRIEVGTQITVLSNGGDAEKLNRSCCLLLTHLWQCDEWMRRNSNLYFESDGYISKVIDFILSFEDESGEESVEYSHVNNPLISNLLAEDCVFISRSKNVCHKSDVLKKLARMPAQSFGIPVNTFVQEIIRREGKLPVYSNRYGLAHAMVDRNPRIAVYIGVFPNGAIWDEQSAEQINIVFLFVFAADCHRTYSDYLTKLVPLLRDNPNLVEEIATLKDRKQVLELIYQEELRGETFLETPLS